jgi:hypothetical protein
VTYPSNRLHGTEVTAVLIAYFDCLLKAIADHDRQIAMRPQHFLTTSSTLLHSGRRGLTIEVEENLNPPPASNRPTPLLS